MDIKKSVTIIELLIICIVIGVLASVTVPSYMNAQKRARDDIARSQLELIQDAEEMWRLETGAYVDCDDNSECNTNLNLDLPAAPPDGFWTFSVELGGGGFCAEAAGSSTSWSIHEGDQNVASGGC